MGKRTWIDSDIWTDTDDLNPTEKYFYICLLTNSQRNIAGYYKVNIKYLSLDMGISVEHILELLEKEQKYWAYDKGTKQVLIPKFTRFNVVKSKQQIAKMNAELALLKPCKLHRMFIDSFVEVNGIGAEELIHDSFKRWC